MPCDAFWWNKIGREFMGSVGDENGMSQFIQTPDIDFYNAVPICLVHLSFFLHKSLAPKQAVCHEYTMTICDAAARNNRYIFNWRDVI